MFKLRSLAITVGACASLFGLDASAQGTIANVTVGDSGSPIGTLTCGQAISRTYVVKNTGPAAVTGKLVFNGVDTAFTLAKNEQKQILASGGNYDCANSPTIEASVPNPSGSPKMAPLWTKKYEADKIKYEAVAVPVSGTPLSINAAGGGYAVCGSPMAIYFKYPSGTAAVPVKASIGTEAFTGTVNVGSALTFTSTSNLDCNAAAVPALGYKAGGATGKLALVSVTFK